MISSEARIAANRRNAMLSTGPTTPEGKAISRANALTHGLCASTIVPEDAKLVGDRADDFFNTLRPQNHFHCFLVTMVSLFTIRIERCTRMERRTRDKMAIKAELCWDDDKRMDAELLGEQLANRPVVVIEQLRKTPQGCEWLMGRWAMLAYTADLKGSWTPSQEQLAFDLLGTPGDFREGHKPGVTIDYHGRVDDAGLNLAAVARREVDLLLERKEVVEVMDRANRALAMADLNDDDPELRKIRKLEGSLHSRLRWCMRQLQQQAPTQEAPRWLKQCWLGYQEQVQADNRSPASDPIPPVVNVIPDPPIIAPVVEPIIVDVPVVITEVATVERTESTPEVEAVDDDSLDDDSFEAEFLEMVRNRRTPKTEPALA